MPLLSLQALYASADEGTRSAAGVPSAAGMFRLAATCMQQSTAAGWHTKPSPCTSGSRATYAVQRADAALAAGWVLAMCAMSARSVRGRGGVSGGVTGALTSVVVSAAVRWLLGADPFRAGGVVSMIFPEARSTLQVTTGPLLGAKMTGDAMAQPSNASGSR